VKRSLNTPSYSLIIPITSAGDCELFLQKQFANHIHLLRHYYFGILSYGLVSYGCCVRIGSILRYFPFYAEYLEISATHIFNMVMVYADMVVFMRFYAFY
jgi:hypothetical protein